MTRDNVKNSTALHELHVRITLRLYDNKIELLRLGHWALNVKSVVKDGSD